jgi:hypothetical protein
MGQGVTLDELATGAKTEVKPVLSDGKTSFSVRYRRRPNEEPLEGVFHIRIPSLGDDLEIARMKVVFANGIPWNCLAPEDQQLFEAMAVCHVLVEKPKPAFFSLPIQELDKILIIGVATKIRQWEMEFFRSGPTEGQNEQNKPRLEIV